MKTISILMRYIQLFNHYEDAGYASSIIAIIFHAFQNHLFSPFIDKFIYSITEIIIPQDVFENSEK